MFNSMEACTSFIFSLKASKYKGQPLEAAKKLLAALGHPEQRCTYIHVAGSNGKGSTVNALREILMAKGYTVGAFISPHLIVPNERVTINKKMISDASFLACMRAIDQAVTDVLDGQYPSFFEVMTVLAFLYFAQQQPDIVLLETGIGGRIDTTNVITPKVSIITTISLEHTQMLGDTFAQVAAEKAGIIKADIPVVVGVKQGDALSVIRAVAHEKQAPLYELGQNVNVTYGEQQFQYEGVNMQLPSVPLQMQGTHQMDNAALAITAARLFDPSISEEIICQALQHAQWAGRFEEIGSNLIVDGAHNLEGTVALVETLRRVYPTKKYIFLYAVMDDKDHQQSIEALSEIATKIVFTQLDMPRAAAAQKLYDECMRSNKDIQKDWRSWLQRTYANLATDELLVVTGSLYFIAEAKAFYMEGWQ